MSAVAVRHHAAVEPANIARLIRQFFRTHGNSDGDVARLPLDLLLGGYEIERNIIVNIQPRLGGSASEPRYGIFWSDETPGPLPAFCGELSISLDASAGGVDLALHGTYTPPLGPVGAAFDAILGQSIARHAAEQFLARICGELEHTPSALV